MPRCSSPTPALLDRALITAVRRARRAATLRRLATQVPARRGARRAFACLVATEAVALDPSVLPLLMRYPDAVRLLLARPSEVVSPLLGAIVPHLEAMLLAEGARGFATAESLALLAQLILRQPDRCELALETPLVRQLLRDVQTAVQSGAFDEAPAMVRESAAALVLHDGRTDATALAAALPLAAGLPGVARALLAHPAATHAVHITALATRDRAVRGSALDLVLAHPQWLRDPAVRRATAVAAQGWPRRARLLKAAMRWAADPRSFRQAFRALIRTAPRDALTIFARAPRRYQRAVAPGDLGPARWHTNPNVRLQARTALTLLPNAHLLVPEASRHRRIPLPVGRRG